MKLSVRKKTNLKDVKHIPLSHSGGENATESAGAVDDAQEPVCLECVEVALDEYTCRRDLLG
jgi:hypothetical protein